MEEDASSDGDEEMNESGRRETTDDVSSEDDESDVEEQQFDISLAASHSYMGDGLMAVRGRSVLEPGWEGRVPVIAHHGAVFPGEIVPMLLTNSHDTAIIKAAIQQDKLFGLLCPDESGTLVSGYGVMCEVFEADADADDEPLRSFSFKARATQRFRCLRVPKRSVPLHAYDRLREADVRVLPELLRSDPLRPARLASLDALRRTSVARDRRLRCMDAAVTPWPLFVYDIFDYQRMRQVIENYFKTLSLEKLPTEPVALSFWTASNLPLAARDRLALFAEDDALLRLRMELRLIAAGGALCCAACAAEIARRDHIFAMSADGVHANYTNPGGFVHDLVTVSRARNTRLSGAPSAEFSWFPGYAWRVATCAACAQHVGWRFDARRRALRPRRFYGLCRNYVQPLRPPPD